MNRAATVVIACLLLSGCASSAQPHGHHPAVPSASVPSSEVSNVTAAVPVAGTVTGNQALAAAQAQHLLQRAVLPPGTKVGPGSAALSGPIMGIAASASVIDKSRTYQVPLPAAQALAWLKQHPPLGLQSSGSAGETNNGVSSGGYSYSAEDSAAWTGAELEIGVAPLSATQSAIRVDGVDLWLDPRPVRDDMTGPRLRVDIATGCPATDSSATGSSAVGVANPGAANRDLDARLLPVEDPNTALVCVYSQARKLMSRQLLDAAAAQRIADPWQRLSLSHTDGTVTSCPGYPGTLTIYAFGYPTRPDVDLQDLTSGCGSLTNGHVRA